MGVQIDETRRDDVPLGIDQLGALVAGDASNLCDATVFDPDVAAEARRPGAVDHHAILDDYVEFRHDENLT